MARSKPDRRTGQLFRSMSGQDELFEKSYEEELETRRGQSVECLGMTFESDEARREHFLEKLKEKLPELRQRPDFPIGDDEDILRLSDPPYYTACPNPFLAEFVKCHGPRSFRKRKGEVGGKRAGRGEEPLSGGGGVSPKGWDEMMRELL